MEIWELDTPSLVIDLDIMENNISRMAGYCKEHNLNLRPHIKTHKIPEIAHLQIKAGAVGITSAKVSEALIMTNAGIKDILIAYPVFGEEKLKTLMKITEKAKVSVALDSVVVADAISKEAQKLGKKIGILVETDTGMKRCGWQVDDELAESAKRISEMKGLEFIGVMIYWGYIKSNSISETEKHLLDVQEYIYKIHNLFEKIGIPIKVISGGSTPTAFLSHKLDKLTEIRPGTYVYNDMNTVSCGSVGMEDCALKVLTSVVSTTVKGQIVIDAGSKTMSCAVSIGKDKGFGKVFGYDNLYINRMNEEHGMIETSENNKKFSVGYKLLVIPNHCCTTNNMHNEVYGVRNNKIELVWQISARGKVR